MRNPAIVSYVKEHPYKTVKELADEFETSVPTIYRWLEYYRISLHKVNAYSDIDIDQIKLLYYTGSKVNEILTTFNISRTYFYNLLKEYNLPLRHEFVSQHMLQLEKLYRELGIVYSELTSIITLFQAMVENINRDSEISCVVIDNNGEFVNRISIHPPPNTVAYEQLIYKSLKILESMDNKTITPEELASYPNIIITRQVFNVYNSFMVGTEEEAIVVAKLLYPDFDKGDMICVSALLNAMKVHTTGEQIL